MRRINGAWGLLIGAVSFSCSAAGDGERAPSGGASCGQASDCMSTCICATSDAAGCQIACGGGNGAAPGAGGFGTGGSGVGGTAGGVGGTGAIGGGVGGTGAGAGGVAGTNSGGGAGFYPMPDWQMDTPESVGLDSAKLNAAAAYSQSFGGLCTVVIRKGKLVFEKYYNGAAPQDLHKSWSVAKSFTSALVGIMLQRGEIKSIDEKASDYVPEWKGTDKENITLRILLQMTEGAQFEFLSDNTFTITSADFTKDSLNRPIVKTPGSTYEYSNMTVQTFAPIIKAATGMDAEQYAKQHLWGPLGFGANTFWFRDPANNPAVFMGVNATCRDMARLGYLYLWHGNWQGTQIVSREWVDVSTHPDPTSPNQAHNNYWWLNGYTPAINSGQEPQPGRLFPDAPADMYMALGFGQNYIDVVPSTETIYIHMRPAPHEDFAGMLLNIQSKLPEMLNDVKDLPHQQMWRDYFSSAG